MKRFLPKTVNNPTGFTLVELLITVSVIAILATIGLAVYGNLGLQAKARNNVRKTDIDNIANALEVNKAVEGGNYIVLAPSQFSNGVIPTDPGTTTAYCGTKNTTDVAVSITAVGGTDCSTITGGTAANWGVVSSTVPVAAASWKVCAELEAEVNPTKTATVYCKRNVQ